MDPTGEKNNNEPTYNPTYQPQQYPTYYNDSFTPNNNNQLQNPYSIPENPYGYQIEPAEQNNSYGYIYNPGVPPDYYNYNNNKIQSFKLDSIENIQNEMETVAEPQNSKISNNESNHRDSNSISPSQAPPPQYIYDPDAPNCQVIGDNNTENDENNDIEDQNSFKQICRCCIKCFCTTFIFILCIAIISSFMFR